LAPLGHRRLPAHHCREFVPTLPQPTVHRSFRTLQGVASPTVATEMGAATALASAAATRNFLTERLLLFRRSRTRVPPEPTRSSLSLRSTR
jgi:hypothetical protein